MAKILVVDDEPGYLEHISEILEADGHEVATAETGVTAVELGQRSCPDVLLADWKLKDRLSGLDVARTLQTINPRLATIMMTGYSAGHMATEAQGVKDMRVLEKPFDADAVRDGVREALQAVTQD